MSQFHKNIKEVKDFVLGLVNKELVYLWTFRTYPTVNYVTGTRSTDGGVDRSCVIRDPS